MNNARPSAGTLLALAPGCSSSSLTVQPRAARLRLDLTQKSSLHHHSGGTDRILASNQGAGSTCISFFRKRGPRAQLPAAEDLLRLRVREVPRGACRALRGRLRLHVIDPQPFSAEDDRASDLGVRVLRRGAACTHSTSALLATNFQFPPDAAPHRVLDPQGSFLEYDVVKLVLPLANPTKPVVACVLAAEWGLFDPAERADAAKRGSVQRKSIISLTWPRSIRPATAHRAGR